jgi:homoserine dehydrogenase
MSMQPPFRIGLVGLGTVGCGVLKLLDEESSLIAQRCGRPLHVVAVSARSKGKDRGCDLSRFRWVDDPKDMGAQPDVDVVVEVMGGEGDPALSLIRTALEFGKPVVTANKALLAGHGAELAKISEDKSAPLMIEAAVLGGVPVIKVLREGLAANTVTEVCGILNGTCNYILTRMEKSGEAFEGVLKDAQKKGYAEAEPSLDVDGWDAAHKLCLLSALAFGAKPNLKALSVTGIRDVSAADLNFAQELGFHIRLIGRALRQKDGHVCALVSPFLVPKADLLASLGGVLNGTMIRGSHSGDIFISGRGAGAEPTASAVVADLIDLARGSGPVHSFGVPATDLTDSLVSPGAESEGRYYLRLSVADQSGVVADITAILREFSLSIEQMIQHGREDEKPAQIVLTLHAAPKGLFDNALSRISALPFLTEKPFALPILM